MTVEASTVQAPAALSRPRLVIGPRLLRLRSDEQLVALFRTGHDEAFRTIYDRYHRRLLGYARQMLPRGHDVEDALQDVFVRVYWALRADNRQLALKAWLFRIAHNRCVDELRRPVPPAPEVLALTRSRVHDPVAETDTRESLRRLVQDIRSLPEQQRSALLMRELGGMSYSEVAAALGTTVPAVKSLLVRSRVALMRAGEARDTACSEIRGELAAAHDRGERASAIARRHLRDCADCRIYRRQLRGVRRGVAALVPVGPLALWSKLLGLSGGSATSAGGTGGGSAVLAGTSGAGGAGAVVGAGHVATLIAAAVASAGGAAGLQHVFAPPVRPHVHAGMSSSSSPRASRAPGSRDTMQNAPASAGMASGPRASALAQKTTTQSGPGRAGRTPATRTAGGSRPTAYVSGSSVTTPVSPGGASSSTVAQPGIVGTAGPPSDPSSAGSTPGSQFTGSSSTPGSGSASTGQTAGGSTDGGQPAGGASTGDGSGSSAGQTAGGGQTSGDGSTRGDPGSGAGTAGPESGTPPPSPPGRSTT